MTEKALRITLPEGLARYVAEGVDRGFYRDESEAVSEALRRAIHADARLTFFAEEHVQTLAERTIGMSWRKSFDHRPPKRDDLEPGFAHIESDEIVPAKITHGVDEMYQDGVLEQHYNFIVYEFEGDDAWMWAKHYLNHPNAATVSRPMLTRDHPHAETDAPDLVRKVTAYMRRRYADVALDPCHGT